MGRFAAIISSIIIAGGIRMDFWPCDKCRVSTVSSGFGERVPPVKGASSFHNGVDFKVAPGTKALSVREGTVSKVWKNKVCGKAVIVTHDENLTSHYCHLGEVYVSIGDKISRGQCIGEVGPRGTGLGTGPHLHFSMKLNGTYIDPIVVLRGAANQVR